uniref:Uncharacterized protein n=1 Tax=Anguilla anguilla TaxID=7936 RepID=A0A0E9UXJ7_ANGAN
MQKQSLIYGPNVNGILYHYEVNSGMKECFWMRGCVCSGKSFVNVCL